MSIHKHVGKISASQALDDEFGILLEKNANGFVDRELAKRFSKLSADAFPPSNNMGGTYPLPPLFLPHGEKSPDFVVKQKTKIDWLAFTSSLDIDAIQLLLCVVWPSVVLSRNSHGMPGYPESSAIMVDGVQFGQFGYGAAHGRNFVSLTGTACKTLTDELVGVFWEALSLPGPGVKPDANGRIEPHARLARIDLCFDLYKGELTIDHALHAYANGRFKRPRANVDPELKRVSTTKGGSNLGRTLYFGKRDGHCFGRIYEKGLEVFAKLPEDQRFLSEQRESSFQADEVSEFKADDWVRLEVEYKRQGKDLPLPLDMMLRRDEYFAGAFPYFADALGVADGVRPAGLKSDFDVDLGALIYNGQRSYGSLFHSLSEMGFSKAEVFDLLSSGRNNDKLVRSGLLAVCKDAVQKLRSYQPDWDIPF